jgi:RNA polymerase sigma factor (sigma-70 family)
VTPQPRARFSTTRWSVVLAAGAEDSVTARTALATLCDTYWFPVYAFVRRRGSSEDEARDLTQAFFTRLIEKRDVMKADQARGRFRTFLLTALTHFLANQFRAVTAEKRGGGIVHLPIDLGDEERRLRQLEPRDTETPERIYERRWALAVLDTALHRLEEHYRDAGQHRLFEGLKGLLTGDEEAPPALLASKLGTSDGALRVALHRLRKRFSKALREVVAETVDGDPAAVEDELRHLMASVSR